jgi:hypothetical protein
VEVRGAVGPALVVLDEETAAGALGPELEPRPHLDALNPVAAGRRDDSSDEVGQAAGVTGVRMTRGISRRVFR